MYLMQYGLLAALLLVSNAGLCTDDVLSGESLVTAEPAFIHREARHLTDDEVEERMARADLVAVLSITHVNSLVSPGLSMPGMLVVQGYEYHGQLEHRWKAAPAQLLRVRVDLSDCSERLEKGESYLVVSRLNIDAQLQSFRCDDLIHQSQAAERIAQFNRLSKLQVASN